jgi:hypothetical protein
MYLPRTCTVTGSRTYWLATHVHRGWNLLPLSVGYCISAQTSPQFYLCFHSLHASSPFPMTLTLTSVSVYWDLTSVKICAHNYVHLKVGLYAAKWFKATPHCQTYAKLKIDRCRKVVCKPQSVDAPTSCDLALRLSIRSTISPIPHLFQALFRAGSRRTELHPCCRFLNSTPKYRVLRQSFLQMFSI